jgi:uncharacterized protein
MIFGLVFLLAVLPAHSSAPPVPVGHWEGVMQRGTAQLRVRFDLGTEREGRSLFSAPDLGAIDIPLANVHLGRVDHWELVGDATTTAFDARADGDVMTGTFHETNHPTGTLQLRRVSSSAARPYGRQDVRFANAATQLAGTVFAPRTPGKHPAVVLVHGSGAEGRWATAYIADDLARRGVVVLTYDKRGVGASTGDWRTSSLDDLAADARQGVHLLAQRSDVDPERVGVYGHSQGAAIAPAIAQDDPEVKWIAAADGPVGPQYRQDLFRVDTALAKRYSGAQLEAAQRMYAEFVDVARNGGSHEKLRADIKAAGDAPWLAVLAIPDDDNWIWEWYRKIGNYDNAQAWAALRVPVLILFGADDALVPAQDSIAEIVRLLKGHDEANVVVRVFPHADHTLRIPPATPNGWPRNAPGFPQLIATFAQSAGRGALR